ncbi:hypothetical protein M8998_08165 [Sphingobacterium sp. lm-10]|uniref:hypothetical protein n=1 Tax=Sphingobacterium sp. lm-10 TaxID=2944904 RepID=UPI0020227556|nr:hypothetical protein [Sphingobacterium sp. lm-10]MCL7987910.1 hypothetical protein [Sphingobacterium sp. lm-10]
MRRYVLPFFLLILTITISQAQTTKLQGAYLMKHEDAYTLWLFVDGYSSMTHYNDKVYLSTMGGPFSFDGSTISIKTEYNDIDSIAVGKSIQHVISMEGENIKDQSGSIWVKQEAESQELNGLWRITGRQQDNEMTTMKRGDRKTIKLLVDGYFQWIAINPAQRGFYGTGGGQYTFKNNKYAEHLLFFSRDNTRIGSSLQFDGEIKDGQWHHKGLSSKGDKIHEVWSREIK